MRIFILPYLQTMCTTAVDCTSAIQLTAVLLYYLIDWLLILCLPQLQWHAEVWFQEPEDTFSYEELALGYANRSAVLFQMKEYELCIRDITRAFNYSYPNNLMYKLFERKSRCQRALKVRTRNKQDFNISKISQVICTSKQCIFMLKYLP